MKITDVRINGMKNPAGYSFDSVRVSWKVTDSEGIAQKDAEIEVSCLLYTSFMAAAGYTVTKNGISFTAWILQREAL